MKILVVLILFSLVSCSSSKEISPNLTDNIESVYYQKWIAGVQGGGSGINFHVNLNLPLKDNVKLEKVQFDTYEVAFEKISETEYVAKINSHQNDLILDENPKKEYGNQAPKVSLKSNEANLIFSINGKEVIKNIQKVKEKPMIAYPSMERPKN
ncbi:hypothetical protein [uncultured Flavobacterium sp.]|uniref:hypothetical protein n=1 Tax=uncultured Flavobacterium sp. TaxID=165435 RepID=UPI0030C81A13